MYPILQTGKRYDISLAMLEVFAMNEKTRTLDEPRIKLSEQMSEKLFEDIFHIFHGKISELAAEKGLPYALVYNLAHGRIRSLSARDYRIIFGEEPLYQEPERVDGVYFRGMVKLWLFLNDDRTETDLYREFHPDKKSSRVDYRILNGKVKTVKTRLEKIMERKFFNQGFDRSEVKEWIAELELIHDEDRVSYEDIKPSLEYLEETLEVSPTRVLNQSYARYESGELKTVPKKVYDYALKLEKRAEEAINSGSKSEIEKLREEIYGKRHGLILYAEVEDELKFLQKYGGKSAKKYLGRSISKYEKSILKRVAFRRAQRIIDDCNELINNRPKLSILSLPKSHLKARLRRVLSILKSQLLLRVIGNEGKTYEKSVLTPLFYEKGKYGIAKYAFISMGRAAYALEMSKKAFDLMVAGNRDIFRRIGHYDGKWHLPTLYLKELSEKEGFYLIKAKYELLAKVCKESLPSRESAVQSAFEPKGKPSQHRVKQSHSDTRKHGDHALGKEDFVQNRQDLTFPESYGSTQDIKSYSLPSGHEYPVLRMQ